MFNPEKEVPSLTLSKKLRELGYPQDGGGWYWEIHYEVKTEDIETTLPSDYKPTVVYYEDTPLDELGCIYLKAPTCRELGEWLPSHKDLQYSKFTGFWKFDKDGYQLCFGDKICFQANNEVIVRAKMLIWLVENGSVKFKKGE